jgi:agmatine deiminase
MNKRHFVLGATSSLLAGKAMAQAKAGYFMPLESAPHLRTFMQWPSDLETYVSVEDLNAVREKIALIANSIAKFEPVVLLCSEDQIESAKAKITSGVEIWPVPVQDLWCRDSGPTFLVDGKGNVAASELNFNGWGDKQNHADDSKIARAVATKLGLPIFENAVVGEGGGVEVDGAGTALAHASCWVNPNRNLGSKAEVEKALLAALGATKMIWASGVEGADITDYHIDALARFVKPGQVLIQLPKKIIAGDPWSAAAFETYGVLKKATDAQGRKLDIVVLPEPINIRSRDENFVSSYVNYYVCNGAVISAEFGDDKADDEAHKILSELYPARQVISLNVDAIGESGGGIHCSTQQQPKVES